MAEEIKAKTKTWSDWQSSYGYYRYDYAKYNWDKTLRKVFLNYDEKKALEDIHQDVAAMQDELRKRAVSFDDPLQANVFKTDQSSCFHRLFYDETPLLDEFTKTYHQFVRDCVLPLWDSRESQFAVQTTPTFRIQLPQTSALGRNRDLITDQPALLDTSNDVIGWHCDAQYNHPPGEINYIVALTPMFESNTVWFQANADGFDREEHYLPVTQEPGTFFHWYGNARYHFNRINRTGKTRISFDFRIIPMSKYEATPSQVKHSLSKGKPFALGGYYTLFCR